MAADDRPAGGQTASGDHDQLKHLGKYEIQKRLGAGGMGTVFLAVDNELKRSVALKVLPKDRAENPTLVKRFKAEGQAAAYLQHRNIVSVYEAGQIDGFLYIALEFIDGTDVLNIIHKRGVIPVKRSIEIIRQIAEALDHAWEKQIVHRDIKPSNLLVKKDGSVKLADLGLARSIDDTLDTSITRAGTTVGTVDYMAPEQARNSKAADIRSDIYSLGCTWYHMLTGVPPFSEGSMTNKLQAHAVSPPPDPRIKNPRVPEGVVAVLERMMAKKPQDRYQTPKELLEDLKNPLLTRTALNADVLQGLASPQRDSSEESVDVDAQIEAAEAEDSTVGDSTAGETISGRRALTNDATAPRRPGKSVSREEPEESEPMPDSPRARAKSRGESADPPRSKPGRVAREEREEEDDSWKSAPYRPSAKRDDDSARSKLPPRSGAPASNGAETETSSRPRKGEGKRRALPPRSDQPILSESPKATIDPEVIKYGLFGLLIVAVLGGLAIAFYNMGGSPDPVPQSVGDNPYATTTFTPQTVSSEAQPAANDKSKEKEKEASAHVVSQEPADAALATSTAARKAAEPLAGAEDLDLSGTAGRNLVPDWVFDVRKKGATTDAPVVIRRGGGDGAFVSLNEALAKLPAGEVVIEFAGDGPFLVTPAELPSRPRLTLRAAAESRPVVVLSTAGLQAGDACLKNAGASLVLENLHFLLAAYDDTPADLRMVAAGAVTAKGCTFTKAGPSALPSTAIDLTAANGKAASGGVLENCVIRGNSLTAARVGERSNLLLGNCLVTSGRAPAILLAPSATKAEKGLPARVLTLLGSTLVTQGTGLELRHGLTDPPQACSFVCYRSAFLAQPGGDAVWLSADPWPAAADDNLDDPLATRLSLTDDKCVFLGWPKLIHFSSGSGATLEANDDAGWKKFWRSRSTTPNLQPALASYPEDQRRVTGTELAGLLEAAGLTRIGCDASKLTSPRSGMLDRVLATSERSRLPADFLAHRTFSEPRLYDLSMSKSEALAAFLSDNEKCPDGSHIRLTGRGEKLIPPLSIQNKTLRLEFVQEAGAPLVLRPKVTGSTKADAWITVTGGSLDLVGGRFELPEATDTRPYPATLLRVDGGDLALRQCSLVATGGRTVSPAALVIWGTDLPDRQGSGLIADSLIIGRAAAVEANLQNRLLEVRNSVIASAGEVFRVDAAEAARGTLVVADSTLAPGTAAFRVGGAEADHATGLSVFLSHSVYVPTFPATNLAPTVLAVPGDAAAKSLTWWEDGVGYGSQLLQRLTIAGQPIAAGPNAPVDWEVRWGDGHVLRALNDPVGVMLDKALPGSDKVDGTSFRLSANCAASNWNVDGREIGARVDEVGPSKEPPAAVEETPTKAPTPKPRRSNQPAF